MSNKKREAVEAAKGAVLAHLAKDTPCRRFGHLMTVCGLSHQETKKVDGLPHARVLDRALQSLRRAAKIKCVNGEWWLSRRREADADVRYYIQDTRSYVGNSVVWWREDGAGYTANLDEAGTYSKEEADSICGNRSTDKPIPEDVAKTAASSQVDVQKLHRIMAERGLT